MTRRTLTSIKSRLGKEAYNVPLELFLQFYRLKHPYDSRYFWMRIFTHNLTISSRSSKPLRKSYVTSEIWRVIENPFTVIWLNKTSKIFDFLTLWISRFVPDSFFHLVLTLPSQRLDYLVTWFSQINYLFAHPEPNSSHSPPLPNAFLNSLVSTLIITERTIFSIIVPSNLPP